MLRMDPDSRAIVVTEGRKLSIICSADRMLETRILNEYYESLHMVRIVDAIIINDNVLDYACVSK